MPHKAKSNYIQDSPWDSPKKRVARWITVIELYRELFQRDALPKDQQYWSLCGAHTKMNQPVKGELGHLLENGLIHKNQYCGVDREKIIIKKNRIHFPDVNWIHGDFIEEMETAISDGNYRPGIINYDGVMQPRNSIQYLKKILNNIDYNVRNELMLVTNFVLWNPYNPSEKMKYDVSDVLSELKQVYWMPDHWDFYPETYIYSYSHAKMGVFIFVKREHDLKKIKYTPNRIIGSQAKES